MTAARERIVCALMFCALMTFVVAGARESQRVHDIRCAVGHVGETRCGGAR